jgi:hypothetical protein
LAIPLTPIAVAALRYGAVAAVAYAAARHARAHSVPPAAEAAMDRMPEGLNIGHAPGQMNATARWRRVVRLGATGPGVEIDLGALARLRLRRIA